MGYIGSKRSIRSQEAIESGLKTYSELSAWQKRAVDRNAVSPAEWHHTGKYFAKTNYYDPDDFSELSPKDFPPEKNDKEEPEQWYVLVSAEWGGTKKHPKITGTAIMITDNPTKTQLTANKYG